MILGLLLKPELKALTQEATFLIVPMLDPDGAVHGIHKNITKSFRNNKYSSPESIAWTGWFRDWVNKGNRLDVVINLHNVESRESPHIACALAEPKSGRGAQCILLNKAIIESLKEDQYRVERHPWMRGYAIDRMGGWLHRYFGNVHLVYELNSQDRKRHLSLYQLRAMGFSMAKAIVKHLNSPEAEPLLASVDARRAKRQLLWDRYEKVRARTIDCKNPFCAEASLETLPSVERLYKKKGHIPGWLRPIYASADVRQDNIPETWLPEWWEDNI